MAKRKSTKGQTMIYKSKFVRERVNTYRITAIMKVETDIMASIQASPKGTQVSSNNKTDRHDITEILLKVAFNTINQTKPIRKS